MEGEENGTECGPPKPRRVLVETCDLYPKDIHQEFSRGKQMTVGSCGQML